MTTIRESVVLVTLILFQGCGSSGGGNTSPTPVATGPVTLTVMGTTRQTSVNGCAGDTHAFTAAEGQISVHLTTTSDPNAALSVQVCSGGNDIGSNCAIRQQKIAMGETLTGVRVGAAEQTLKFLPFACVFSNTVDPTPITYSASLTHQR